MKVILKEDVKGLGVVGSVVNVADGYARNYLIPRNLAIEANPRSLRSFEHEKRQIMLKAQRAKNAAEELAKRLSEMRLEIISKAGEEGKLFGSITTMDIAKAISEQGIEIDRRNVLLTEPIKRIGRYDVTVKVHPEITARLSIDVRREE